MNLVQNKTMHPHLRDEEALVVENAIRLATDSIINVLYGVNSARAHEHQRMVADRDKEIQRLECRLREIEHELQVLRRQGCTCRMLERERTRTPGDPPKREQGGFEPSCMDTEMTAGQQECEMSISLGLFATPSSHVSSRSPESALPSSPSRMGLDQSCTSRSSESPGVSDAAGNPPASPSRIAIKEEPCDTFLIKWEMSEERIEEHQGSTDSPCQDKESPEKLENRERRKFREKPDADPDEHHITDGEHLSLPASLCHHEATVTGQPAQPFVTDVRSCLTSSTEMLEPSDLITEGILSALPSIPVESLGGMVEKLIQQGVEIEQDPHEVREQDTEEFIKPTQCRKRLDAWKHKEPVSISAPPRQMSTCIPPDQSFSLSSGPLSSPPASPLPANWPDTFKVNWDKMPPSLNTCIRNGKRPSPADRRKMIRVLVDDMRKIELNPSRVQCLIVARDIARQYPQSFMDTMDGGRTTVGAGYESLLCQIKTRIEHLNRNNALARRRTSKHANGAKRGRGPADTYGCTQWQPELPPGETEASLENKRQKLVELFSREGSSGMERAEVLKLMQTTYYSQRRMINANPAPALEDVKQQWPYLFLPRSMCAHFEVLTGVPIVQKIEAFLEEHGRNIMEFFKQKPTNDDVKAVLFRTDCRVTASNILQVLMAHFKEPLDALIIQTDVSATPAFVQLTVTLPDTPRLIVAGPVTQTNRWMLSIEKEVLCEGTSFVLGLAVVLSSYYNFNLQYQHDAACTLEFIQRSCININPERGTKASCRKVQSKKSGKMVQKKPTSVNPHVRTLIKKISDFKWSND